jgi:hypothetical protein
MNGVVKSDNDRVGIKNGIVQGVAFSGDRSCRPLFRATARTCSQKCQRPRAPRSGRGGAGQPNRPKRNESCPAIANREEILTGLSPRPREGRVYVVAVHRRQRGHPLLHAPLVHAGGAGSDDEVLPHHLRDPKDPPREVRVGPDSAEVSVCWTPDRPTPGRRGDGGRR